MLGPNGSGIGMTKFSFPRARLALGFRLWLALLPLYSLACNNGSQPNASNSSSEILRIDSLPHGHRAAPPQVTAAISNVKIHWGDGQQLFTLTLTNIGDTAGTVHAIVYATNEEIQPPRRAISPATAYQWFELAGSKDGRLTAQDIQKNWKTNVFVTARGGKLPFSWQATLEPGDVKNIEAAHVLDERSPHPASKGKKLAHVGFREYQIWLFTAEGRCFDEQTLPALPPEQPVPEPSPKKTTAPRKEEKQPTPSTKQEEEAAKALRLARYYLDNKKLDLARAKLQLILRKYPETAAAAEAKKLLAKIPKN